MTVAAVIGLGTMGAGIVAMMARGGMVVRAFDTNAEAVRETRKKLPAITQVLDDLLVPKGGSATDVTFCGSMREAVADADLVLENVPEDLELKRHVLNEIAGLVPERCVIASDTSGIPISKLQDGMPSPERVIGMHWSNPPHIIPVVEIVAGEQTDASTVDWMFDRVRRLSLVPVRVKRDVPGFVENRILYAIMREALDLVESGVIEPEDLDACVNWGIGYKLAVVGPMSLLDMAGLDIYGSVASYLNADLCRRGDVGAYAAERIESGKLGMKTGEGIYRYEPGEAAELGAARTARLVAIRRALGV